MEHGISSSPTSPIHGFVSPPAINSIGTEAFLRGIEIPFMHNGKETTLKEEFIVILSQLTGNWLQETRNILRVFNTGDHISTRLPVSTEGMARLLNGTSSITKDDFIDRCSLRESLTIIPHKRPIEEKTANKEEFLKVLDQPYPVDSGVANLRDRITKQVANRVVIGEFWTITLTKILIEHNELFPAAKPLPRSPVGIGRCLNQTDSIDRKVFSSVTGIQFPIKETKPKNYKRQQLAMERKRLKQESQQGQEKEVKIVQKVIKPRKERPRPVVKTKPVKKPVIVKEVKKNPMQIQPTQEQKNIHLLEKQQKKDQRAIEQEAQRDATLAARQKQVQEKNDLREEQRRQERILKAEEAELREGVRKKIEQEQKTAVKITLPRTYGFRIAPGTVEIGGIWYDANGREIRNQPTEQY